MMPRFPRCSVGIRGPPNTPRCCLVTLATLLVCRAAVCGPSSSSLGRPTDLESSFVFAFNVWSQLPRATPYNIDHECLSVRLLMVYTQFSDSPGTSVFRTGFAQFALRVGIYSNVTYDSIRLEYYPLLAL
ncbi:hypothetical protein C8R43DRAFT_610567 [Mycena crocata]|nr:hypothetical protein C8R43DRAFT_610567 [Mycena crocata]